MKSKIEISEIERIIIVAALSAHSFPRLGFEINLRFQDADPANDGPEVAILSVDRS